VNAELDSDASHGNRGAGDEAEANRALERVRSAFAKVNGVLDVVPEAVGVSAELEQWVGERLKARAEARRRRDFAAADAIRGELEREGIAIEDTAQGTRWKKVQ
jgi:cysteinyl-tRNA synthetase